MGRNKMKAKHLEHQTLISFYWHHDSLNLFINFSSLTPTHSLVSTLSKEISSHTTSTTSNNKTTQSRSFMCNVRSPFYTEYHHHLWPAKKLKQKSCFMKKHVAQTQTAASECMKQRKQKSFLRK